MFLNCLLQLTRHLNGCRSREQAGVGNAEKQKFIMQVKLASFPQLTCGSMTFSLSRETYFHAEKNLSDLRRSVGHQEDPGGEGDQDEGDDGGYQMLMNITMQCHVL